MVIGLVGPKLSGKGTAATFLRERHGAVVYSMSGILSDIADRLYLPKTRANLIAIATGLREQFGKDILARVLKQDVETHAPKLAVIDGIRMSDEVALFSQLPNFHLLYIDAPLEVRYKRALTRGEKEGESTMTFEQFQSEEQAVTETGIAALQAQAASTLVNTGTVDELFTAVEQFCLAS